jgi:branched-chain amino acid transport system substrate-binding protein
MRSGRLRVAVALIAALAFAGAACGNEGDDDNAGESTQTGAPAGGGDGNQFADLKHVDEPNPCVNDPGVTDSDIKVGVIAVESGPQATSFGSAVDGIKARIDKANQESELGKRKITLVERDDTGDQTRNTEVARDLVEQEKVFGIIEVTSVSGGSAPYLNEQKIPVTGWHVGVPAWATYPNMFAFRQGTADDPENEYTTRNAELLDDQGATKLALMGGGNQSSALFIDRVKRSVEQAGKIDVVYENVAVPPEQRDFTAEVQAIKNSGADAAVTGMDLLQNAALSDALAKAGITMKVIVFPGGYDPRVLSVPGIEGATFGLEFYPFELHKPAFQEFDKWAPDSTTRGQVPFIGWLSGEIFVRGLEEAGTNCPTRAAFIDNLRLVKDYDGNGAFDPVNLTENFGNEFPCAYYVKVEGGAFVPQYDGKAFCGDPIELK